MEVLLRMQRFRPRIAVRPGTPYREIFRKEVKYSATTVYLECEMTIERPIRVQFTYSGLCIKVLRLLIIEKTHLPF